MGQFKNILILKEEQDQEFALEEYEHFELKRQKSKIFKKKDLENAELPKKDENPQQDGGKS